MRRICVLGNSHLGLVRRVVSEGQLPLSAEITFTYFACHLNLLPDLESSGRSLLPRTDALLKLFRTTSGGLSTINVDDFDEFFIIGHGFSIHSLVFLAERYRCDSLRGPRSARYLLSDDCFAACATQRLVRGEAMRVARLIRALTPASVTIASEPNLGLGLTKSDAPWWLAPHYQAVEEGEDKVLAEMFRAVCHSLAQAHSLTIVPPLAEIAANGLFNHREFCLLTDTPPDAANDDRVNAMLHGNRASALHLARTLFSDTARP